MLLLQEYMPKLPDKLVHVLSHRCVCVWGGEGYWLWATVEERVGRPSDTGVARTVGH